MSLFDIRLQLFGIALILAGGFRDLQLATRGFTTPGPLNVGEILVIAGVLIALVGTVRPVVADN